MSKSHLFAAWYPQKWPWALEARCPMSEIKGSPSTLFHTGQHHVSQLIDGHRRPAYPQPRSRPVTQRPGCVEGLFLRAPSTQCFTSLLLEMDGTCQVRFFLLSFFLLLFLPPSLCPPFFPSCILGPRNLGSFLLSIFQAVLLLLPVFPAVARNLLPHQRPKKHTGSRGSSSLGLKVTAQTLLPRNDYMKT